MSPANVQLPAGSASLPGVAAGPTASSSLPSLLHQQPLPNGHPPGEFHFLPRGPFHITSETKQCRMASQGVDFFPIQHSWHDSGGMAFCSGQPFRKQISQHGQLWHMELKYKKSSALTNLMVCA